MTTEVERSRTGASASKPGASLNWIDVVTRHRIAAVTIILLIFPWLAPYEALAVNILIFGLFAMGFNLIFGYAGMLSFGHAAFFGLGAYGCGVAIAKFGIAWFPALIIGVVLAGLGAAIIGGLAIRTRGIYFAMVTLALSQVIYYGAYQWVSMTGGEDGLRGVRVPEVDLGIFQINLLNAMEKYYFILFFVVLAMWTFSRILGSPFGAVLEALRENEQRARACGYDVTKTRWLAVVLSGLYSGLAGALYAIHLSVVPIETLHYFNSATVVMMTLLGGMGTFFGPFLGAFTYLMLEDVITVITVHWQLFVGALFVFLILFFPKGIWGTILVWVRR